jgi:hypothetical protein
MQIEFLHKAEHRELIIMRIKSLAYKALRTSNDINAIRRGKVGRRVARRVYGKASGRVARKIFG